MKRIRMRIRQSKMKRIHPDPQHCLLLYPKYESLPIYGFQNWFKFSMYGSRVQCVSCLSGYGLQMTVYQQRSSNKLTISTNLLSVNKFCLSNVSRMSVNLRCSVSGIPTELMSTYLQGYILC